MSEIESKMLELDESIQKLQSRIDAMPDDEQHQALRETSKKLMSALERMKQNLQELTQQDESLQANEEGGNSNGSR